jgi:hypothetical protein
MKKLLFPTLVAATALTGCGLAAESSLQPVSASIEALLPSVNSAVFEGPVAKAICGVGSKPETGLQGRVPQEDVVSGRAAMGYTCNLELIGRQGTGGGGIMMAWYKDCAYYANFGQGVSVLDVSDPTNPVETARLRTPAMLDPWESLKVTQKRGLLAATSTGAGPAAFEVYDLKPDCRQPVLKSVLPVNTTGHEGEWSPDGLTYYASGLAVVTPIDVSNPAIPKALARLTFGSHGFIHGLGISDDGRRMYLANQSGFVVSQLGNGLDIYDISQIQARSTNPSATLLSSVYWDSADGTTGQHAIPVTIKGRPFAIFVEEGGYGAARIIDIEDEKKPRVISKLKLEIHMPENRAAAEADGSTGSLNYDGHYCTVARRDDPDVVVCNMMWSGLRVFDIRNPYQPKEIAYYNPGSATSGQLQPRFIPERGEIWVTWGNHGFHVLRLSSNVWPLK